MKISAKFTSLAAAVAAAAIDLSYNENLAKKDISVIDRNCREAFIMEDGSVHYIFEAGRHGRLFHKFTPFCSVVSDSLLRPAFIEEDEIKFIDLPISKSNMKARKAISDAGMLLA